MSRLRYAGVTGTVGSGNMTNSATSHTFTAALTYSVGATVPTLAGNDYFMLSILDTSGNLSEVVKVTAYNSSTGAATIVRAQEGTTGVTHTSGDKVTMASYASDALWTPTLSLPLTTATTGWSSNAGTWTGETDRFRLNNSGTNSAMRLTYGTRLPAAAADVELDIRIDTSTNTTSSRAGIVFGTAGGGLLVALACVGSTTQTTKIHTELDGVSNLVDLTLGAAINHSTWMTLRVIRVGSTIDVYLQGTLIWSEAFHTNMGTYDPGNFCLIGFAVDASFRNLRYNTLPLA